MARAIFKSWFVDFDPVKAKTEGRDPGLPADIAALFPDSLENSELGMIPKGWKCESLKQHIEAVKGLSYKGKFLSDVGMPLHNLNSVYEGGGYKYSGLKRYTGEYKERHLLQPGDVIVANTEQGFDYLLIGYPAIVPKCYEQKGLFSHHLFRVRPLKDTILTPHYIYLLLCTPYFHSLISGYTNGTTVNMLPLDGLQRPKFIVPQEKVMRPFQQTMDSIFARIEESIQHSKNLTSIRDTLLPKLVSGEIRIKDATKFIEEEAV